MLLVAIVVLVFLQDWKAMILPMIDVPVSLIGTFAIMAAMGFTLNNLTLFGLVLAIGIVVDDAIVVLENIERLIATGLDARTATIKAMDEITGPVLAITLVLSSVFVPCCFLGGVSGPVLPPVRGDDLRLDDHLGRQRPDHDPVPGRGDLQDRGGPRNTDTAARPCPGGSSASWAASSRTTLVPQLLAGKFDLDAALRGAQTARCPGWLIGAIVERRLLHPRRCWRAGCWGGSSSGPSTPCWASCSAASTAGSTG